MSQLGKRKGKRLLDPHGDLPELKIMKMDFDSGLGSSTVSDPCVDGHKWRAECNVVDDVTTRCMFVDPISDTILSVKEFIDGLINSEHIRMTLNDTLKENNHSAFFFESKPVHCDSLDSPYEFSIISTSHFDTIKPNGGPFAEHLADGGENEIRSFPNLGRDATLVCPCKNREQEADTYTHIANFVRNAPKKQIHKFWEEVGHKYLARIEENPKPVWLSTSGLGVYWLHVRICDSPKYYSYTPFRTFSNAINTSSNCYLKSLVNEYQYFLYLL